MIERKPLKSNPEKGEFENHLDEVVPKWFALAQQTDRGLADGHDVFTDFQTARRPTDVHA